MNLHEIEVNSINVFLNSFFFNTLYIRNERYFFTYVTSETITSALLDFPVYTQATTGVSFGAIMKNSFYKTNGV